MLENKKIRKPGTYSSIPARLLRYFIIYGVSFALLAVGIELYIGYFREMDSLNDTSNYIQQSYLAPLSASAYHLDYEQLQRELNGVVKLRYVEYAEVYETRREQKILLASVGRAGDDGTDFIEAFRLPYLAAPEGAPPAATLEVHFSKTAMYSRLRHFALRSVLVVGGQAILGAVLLYTIIYFMITRHLKSMANYAKNLDFSKLGKPLILKRKSFRGFRDELDVVREAFNTMRLRMLEDIEQLMRSEEELRRSQENLAITLNSIADGVIATDTEGRINRMNPVAEKLTGWSMVAAVGAPVSEVFKLLGPDTGDPLENPVMRVLKEGEALETVENAVLVSKNGTEIYVDESSAPILDRSGNVVGAVLVFRDVTREHMLQQQLRQTEKMKVVGQLAGGVAHDFNNLLMAIGGNAEFLMNELKDGSEEQNSARDILDASARGTQLTQQLLSFSRKGTLSSEKLDMHEIIRESARLLEKGIDKRISLELKLEAANCSVTGDHSRLVNAILNIGINARDAMPDGGHITISTRDVELETEAVDHVFGETLPTGKYIEIDVNDTGAGMSPELQEHIFEPFFTTKTTGKGTGLGLSGVLATISDHKGSIKVYSRPGFGSTFKILLPLDKGDKRKTSKSKSRKMPRGTGNILVVDDEMSIRNYIRRALEKLGYQTRLAENGRRAIDIFLAEKDRIDLVLLDLIMPELGGEQVMSRTLEEDPEMPVIIMSGFNNHPTSKTLLDSGAKTFLPKPFQSETLAMNIRRYIRKKKNS